jgi:hypothetical protein
MLSLNIYFVCNIVTSEHLMNKSKVFTLCDSESEFAVHKAL